jgi:hypothetical protein
MINWVRTKLPPVVNISMQTAQEIYSNEVLVMPPTEQLRLASLILDGLTGSAAIVPEYSEHWSEEDLRDVTAFSAKHAADTIGEE